MKLSQSALKRCSMSESTQYLGYVVPMAMFINNFYNGDTESYGETLFVSIFELLR